MAAGDTQITIVGNLVGDPELRYTPTGAGGRQVPRGLHAALPRQHQGEWKDGDSLFLDAATSGARRRRTSPRACSAGMRVIVSGRLQQRSYETREGEKRTVYEIEVDEVGPSLRNASAKVVKSNRSAAAAAAAGGGGSGRRRGGGGGGGSRPAEDPWAARPVRWLWRRRRPREPPF